MNSQTYVKIIPVLLLFLQLAYPMFLLIDKYVFLLFTLISLKFVSLFIMIQKRNEENQINLKMRFAFSLFQRWLRQAMHEVPAPVAFNHSLSVSTDSGSASPIHGSSSPNPGTGLGSPGAGSSLGKFR